MPNPYFRFKQFIIYHDRCAMKVTTDACLFGAWCAAELEGSAVEKALDIGTGTGLLAMMVAQKTNFHIDAVEIDGAAATQAAENFAAAPWGGRIKAHHASIQEFTPAAAYEAIFCNPPFYENELEAISRDRNIAHHGTGLKLNELLAQIERLLTPNGTAYLLLPYKRANEAEKLLNRFGFCWKQKIVVHPSSAHPPFRLLLSVKKGSAAKIITETIFIQDSAGHYTLQFTGLLKDYYLYL